MKLAAELNEEEKKEIMQHLPEAQQTEEGLKANLCSPQLSQALKSLSQAVQQSRENVEMIMAMCDLDSAPDFSKDGIDALIKAFVKKYSQKK